MTEQNTSIAKMMSIREIAATGILPEHAIRTLVRENRIPYIKVGSKVLINNYILTELLKGNI